MSTLVYNPQDPRHVHLHRRLLLHLPPTISVNQKTTTTTTITTAPSSPPVVTAQSATASKPPSPNSNDPPPPPPTPTGSDTTLTDTFVFDTSSNTGLSSATANGGPTYPGSNTLSPSPSASFLSSTTTTPLPDTPTEQNAGSNQSNNVRTGPIAGGVVGAFIFVICLAIVAVLAYRRWRRDHTAPSAMFKNADPNRPISPFQRLTESRISEAM